MVNSDVAREPGQCIKHYHDVLSLVAHKPLLQAVQPLPIATASGSIILENLHSFEVVTFAVLVTDSNLRGKTIAFPNLFKAGDPSIDDCDILHEKPPLFQSGDAVSFLGPRMNIAEAQKFSSLQVQRLP